MASVVDVLIEGRRRRNWSQQDLAQRVGISVSTVSRAEQGRGLPNTNTLRRLALFIGYDADALVRLAREPNARHPARWLNTPPPPAQDIPGITTADHLQPHLSGSAPNPQPPTLNSQPSSDVRVPHYGSVSAVRSDLRDAIPGDHSQVPDVGVDFTVTVDGQCMEPRYDDGERVGCSIRRWETEGFVWGKDYWIRFKDGDTTLKRVKPDPRNHEKFICSPLNPKAKAFSRFKADVAAAARVLVVIAG